MTTHTISDKAFKKKKVKKNRRRDRFCHKNLLVVKMKANTNMRVLDSPYTKKKEIGEKNEEKKRNEKYKTQQKFRLFLFK